MIVENVNGTTGAHWKQRMDLSLAKVPSSKDVGGTTFLYSFSR